jgi:hypothetical protein
LPTKDAHTLNEDAEQYDWPNEKKVAPRKVHRLFLRVGRHGEIYRPVSGSLASGFASHADNISDMWMKSCPRSVSLSGGESPKSRMLLWQRGKTLHYRVRPLDKTTAQIPSCHPVSTSTNHPPLTCKCFSLDALAAFLRKLPTQQLHVDESGFLDLLLVQNSRTQTPTSL